MPTVDTYTTTADPNTPKPFYNVTMAVGTNASNRRDDVLLVQYMLKRVYEKPTYTRGRLSTQQGQMIVDGLCGPTTIRWIGQFQLDIQRFGANVLVDRRIDRALGGSGSISGTEYTIHLLNDAFRKHYPDIYQQMTTHSDVPVEVRAALVLSTGGKAAAAVA